MESEDGLMEPTLPETNSSPLKIDPWKFGDSYWKSPFLGCMLVLRTVHILCFGGDEEHPKIMLRQGDWIPRGPLIKS